jgi:superfamily II DNA/RNA helicase
MSYKFRSSRQQHSRPRSNNRRYSRKTGQNINPSRFVKAATATEAEVYVPKQLFSDFDIRRELKVNLEDKGYKMPSPIQDQTIGPALEGRDIIGIASTGTGKTAAFLVPILNKLSLELNSKALIIAPTRELAQQIDVELKALGKGSGIKSTIIIGGARMGYQLRDLKQNPRVVIGTPGRIKDHINRGTLRLQDFNVVVLDEVC